MKETKDRQTHTLVYIHTYIHTYITSWLLYFIYNQDMTQKSAHSLSERNNQVDRPS